MIRTYAALAFWKRVFEDRMMHGVAPSHPLRLRTVAVGALHVDPAKGAPWMVITVDEKKGVRISNIQELSNSLRWTITIVVEVASRAFTIDDAMRATDALANAVVETAFATLSTTTVIEERRDADNAVVSLVVADLFESEANVNITYWIRGSDKDWVVGAKISFDHTIMETTHAPV
jgi:hypothetical protein